MVKEEKGYLALGGNLGDTRCLFRIALMHLSAIPSTRILSVASLYCTPATGQKIGWNQPGFLNTVCHFSTKLSLDAWMQQVQHIERLLGKLPKLREAPRPIDLDLLFFGHEYRNEGHFLVPHPRWKTRLFVVGPLMDLTSHVEVRPSPELDVERIALQPLLEQLSLEGSPLRRVAW